VINSLQWPLPTQKNTRSRLFYITDTNTIKKMNVHALGGIQARIPRKYKKVNDIATCFLFLYITETYSLMMAAECNQSLQIFGLL
jgi:hypothetical protein